MGDQGEEGRFARLRARFLAWLDKPGQTNRNAIITGVISGAIVAGAPAALGLILSATDVIDLSGNLPAALVAAVGGVGLVLGFIGAMWLAQLIYRPRLAAAELKLEVEEGRREKLEPRVEDLKRLTAYIDHYLLVLHDVLAGRHGLGQFPHVISSELSEPLCEVPSTILKTAADIDATCSVWVEQPRRLGHDRYTIELGPYHTAQELEDFAVRIDQAWIGLSQRNRRPDVERVQKIDDLDIAGFYGADLDAFRKHGYRSVRVLAIPSGDQRFTFLVVLSKTAVAFSSLEDQWLLLLSAALSLAAQRRSPPD